MRVTPGAELVLPVGADRSRWLAKRKHGITATDVVALAGLSTVRNAHDVWLDKRGLSDDTAAGEAARWGQLLEEPVAREWAARTGNRVRRVGLLAHSLHPHHLATCDRIIVGQHAVLEVKTRSAFAAAEWENDALPDRVAAQVQWQMHVTGFDLAVVAALIGGQRLITVQTQRDPDIINYLVGLADDAWDAAHRDTPPELDPNLLRRDSLDALHPNPQGAVQVDPAKAAELVGAYRRASAEAAAAGKTRDQAGLALQQLIGEGETAMVGDRVAFTRKATAPSWRGTDLGRAAQIWPELVATGFITQQPGARRLHIPKERP